MKTKFSDSIKYNHKYKGLRPFTHGRKGWKEDAATEKIKYENAVGGVLFDEKLLVLEGNELPELFVIWKIAFMNRIYNHPSLAWDSKIKILTRICRSEALAVVNNTLMKCRDNSEIGFENITIKNKVRELDEDAGDFDTYLKTDEYKEDIVKEILYHLSLKVFGSDHAGKSAYIQLRRTIHQFKVDLNYGIRTWAERMEDFQSYLPHCPWNAGERRQEKPRAFTEYEMREILEHNLLFEQLMELYNMDWSIQDQPYKETITKLEGLEASIIKEKQMQKRISALEGNGGGINTSSKKRKVYNASTDGDKDTTKKNSNSGQCPHCGKRHRGECRFKPTGSKETSSANNYRDVKFNKPQRQYINQLVQAAVKKTKSESNIVESDEDEEWSKGMTASEHMYVLSAAQADQGTDSTELEIDDDDLEDFKRRFRATKKKMKKSNSRK
jgi:hypothetical protein